MQHGHIEPPEHGYWKDEEASVEEEVYAGRYEPIVYGISAGAVNGFVPVVGNGFAEAECLDADEDAVEHG